MSIKMDNLIKMLYREWKNAFSQTSIDHPQDETIVAFLNGSLPEADAERLKGHLIGCRSCAEAVEVQLRLSRETDLIKPVPEELKSWAKNLVAAQNNTALEIVLKLKGKIWEVLGTNGDILLGQELVPALVLRSRKRENFKDEVTILKDFKDIRVEIKIENSSEGIFDLIVMARDKHTQRSIKDLRFSLIKDELELESYSADSGKIIFEHVLLGSYRVDITNLNDKLASILIDIKK
ncbi:hypothetical protein D4R78_04310 [bacterium]|nr:MAG: hypothetical protein D4R78_04310 [bacterium]